MNRALFLDRDGVINEDYGYVHKIENFHFREGIFEVCEAAQKARMKIIVVTNQAGIGRGIYSENDFQKLTSYMIAQFSLASVVISGIYHCPFHPTYGIGHFKQSSFDRKPNPGMLVKAASAHNINPKMSIMIGDRDTDKAAAESIGIISYIDASKSAWVKNSIEALNL
jgi:D-glycero-D-manno-heptose 1,7-bisphosphate phosphatase